MSVLFCFSEQKRSVCFSIPFLCYALLLSTQKDLPRSGTVNRKDPPVATTRKSKNLFHLVLTGNFFLDFPEKL